MPLGELSDGEFRCAVSWLPKTTEVAAFVIGWSDERAHRNVIPTMGSESGTSWVALGTERIPELVYVLGRAPSVEEAQHRMGSAASLEAIRRALS